MSAVNNGIKKKLAAAFRWKTINSFNLEFDTGSFFALTGYSYSEFLTKKLDYLSIIHPADKEMFLAYTKSISLSGESPFEYPVYRLVTKKKKVIHVKHFLFFGRTAKGRLKNVFGFIHDYSTEISYSRKPLISSEEKYRMYVENAPFGVLVVNREGNYVDANKTATALYGYSRDEFLKIGIKDMIDTIAVQEGRQHFEQVKKTGYAEGAVSQLRKDGTTFLALLSAVKLNNNRFIAFVQDITKKHETEEALKQSEKNYREIFNSTNEAIIINDAKGNIHDINATCIRMYGYSRNEFLALNIADISSGEQPYNKTHALEKIKKTRDVGPQVFEWLCKRKDGSLFWTEVSLRSTSISGKGRTLAVIRDISDRRAAEEALRLSEEKFRYAFKISPDAVNLNRVSDGLYLEINEGFTKITGYTEKDVTGKTSLTLNIWNNPADRNRMIEMLRTKGYVDNLEAEFAAKDGRVLTGLLSATIMKINNEEIILSITRDITERKKYLNELRNKNIFIQTVLDSLPIGVALNRINDGYGFYMNKKFEEIYGWPSDELQDISRFFEKVYPDPVYRKELMKRVFEDIESADASRMHWENCYITRRDGTHRIINAVNIPLFEQDTMVSTVIDITAMKKAEELLEHSEIKYRTVADYTYDLEYWIDTDNQLVYISPSCERITGYTREEFGKNKNLLDQIVHPDDRSAALNHSDHVESVHNAEFRITKKDKTVAWINHTCRKISTPDGKPLGIRGSNREVTNKKLAEEKLKTALAEKETLLRELYHRTKNNMQVIRAMLKMQTRSIKNEDIKRIVKEADSRILAMSLVHQKLYQSKNLSRIDLKDYITDLVNLLISNYSVEEKKIEVRFILQNLSAVIDIAIPLGLIINELISNIFKHAFAEDQQGKILVKLLREKEGFIHLTIADNGKGVSEGFNFNEQKSLGMQTVYALGEQQLNGKITFVSKKGLRIDLVFPEHLYLERI